MIDPTKLLAGLPAGLRTPLIECYTDIVRNYSERRWRPAELEGGRFCEVVYTILDGAISGTYAATPSKPSNMLGSCQSLESRPANPTRVGDRSLRIMIPRLLPVLYEIRNNRNVGHVGGDVDPNHADAEAVLAMTGWVMAELVRIFHGVSLSEAQEAIDSLVERRHPLVWESEGIKRVLAPAMDKGDQALVLLYSETGWVEVQKLFEWVEYSRLTDFVSKVLMPRHKARLLELDLAQRRVRLTTLGGQHVENKLIRR